MSSLVRPARLRANGTAKAGAMPLQERDQLVLYQTHSVIDVQVNWGAGGISESWPWSNNDQQTHHG